MLNWRVEDLFVVYCSINFQSVSHMTKHSNPLPQIAGRLMLVDFIRIQYLLYLYLITIFSTPKIQLSPARGWASQEVYSLPSDEPADQYTWFTTDCFHSPRSSQPLTFEAALIFLPIPKQKT